MSIASARGVAFARAALAGNPSDGYGGATLALALPARRAEVRVSFATETTGSITPPSELVRAAVDRFTRESSVAASSVDLEWTTTIPRSVGLGGSSAIVIATLRALSRLHHVPLEPLALAQMAWAVEAEDLGITAGMQDRLAQSFEGLTFMDFSGTVPEVQTLDQAALPPMLIAWRSDFAGDSGRVHSELRARVDRREPGTCKALRELATLAWEARDALEAGDSETFASCVDQSFDRRRSLMTLDDRHVAMIERARESGAGANYTGSGGAIVAICRDPEHRRRAARALAELGCSTIG